MDGVPCENLRSGPLTCGIEAWLVTVPYWFRKVGAGYAAFVVSCVVVGDSAERAAREARENNKDA